MIVDIQFSPAAEPWESLRDGVQLAEACGFDTAFVFDHFAGNLLNGHTMLECFALLGAMAGSTSKIGIGTLVVNVANRNPGVMAMGAASVQTISGGRLVLGLGAGASPNTSWSAEHRELGLHIEPTMALRHARLGAALDEIDRLWHPGRADALASFPTVTPRPPVILGVNSDPLARMAAERTDGFNVRSSHEQLDELVTVAREARAASDRAAEPMTVSVWAEWDEGLADPDHPSRRRWSDLGVNRVVLVWLRPHDPAAMTRFAEAAGLAQR